MKLRPGDQPLPVKNDAIDIQTLVSRDIEARRQVGIERYGTALQPHNGRDALRDAYEEAIDLTMYLRQLIEERVDDQPYLTLSEYEALPEWLRRQMDRQLARVRGSAS